MKFFNKSNNNPDKNRYRVKVSTLPFEARVDTYDEALDFYKDWCKRAEANEVSKLLYSSYMSEKCYVYILDTFTGRNEKSSRVFDIECKKTSLYPDFNNNTKEVFAEEMSTHASFFSGRDKWVEYIVYIIGIGLASWFILWMNGSNREWKVEQERKQFLAGQTYSPIVIPGGMSDVTEKSSDGKIHAIPCWSNHDGDYEKCRRDLVKRFEAIYGQKKYAHSPEHTSIRIDKDTLYLASICFREQTNIKYAISNYIDFFRDCDFHTVRFTQVDAGGQRYVEIKFDENWSLIYPNKKAGRVSYEKIKDLKF